MVTPRLLTVLLVTGLVLVAPWSATASVAARPAPAAPAAATAAAEARAGSPQQQAAVRTPGTAVAATRSVQRPDPATTDELVVALLAHERSDDGLPPLRRADDLDAVALAWATRLADDARLRHNPRLAEQVEGWLALAENVGSGADVAAVHTAIMSSAPHRASVLGDYDEVGVAVVPRDGTLWVVEVFRRHDPQR